MKKVIAFLSIIAFGMSIIGCQEQAELPPLNFAFEVVTQENFSEKGVNEKVQLQFEIKKDYVADIPFKYKVETSETAEVIDEDENKQLRLNEFYDLKDSDMLTLSYTGRKKGKHKIKVTFSNNKKVFTKELEIEFKEYDFTLEVLNLKNYLSQGEENTFDLKITTKNPTIKENYTITFLSYDKQDLRLEKTLIAFNDKKVELGKEYKIEDLQKAQIKTKPFYYGMKEMIIVIKNSTTERKETISQQVTQNSISAINWNLSNPPFTKQNNKGTFSIEILKSYKASNYVEYRTVVKQTGIPLEAMTIADDWTPVYMDSNNRISFPFEISKFAIVGTTTIHYEIYLRDEFGNEVSPSRLFIIDVKGEQTFQAEMHVTNTKKIIPTKPFDIQLKITTPNYHSSVNYYAVFPEYKITDTSGKIYEKNTPIPIQIRFTKAWRYSGAIHAKLPIRYRFN